MIMPHFRSEKILNHDAVQHVFLLETNWTCCIRGPPVDGAEKRACCTTLNNHVFLYLVGVAMVATTQNNSFVPFFVGPRSSST